MNLCPKAQTSGEKSSACTGGDEAYNTVYRSCVNVARLLMTDIRSPPHTVKSVFTGQLMHRLKAITSTWQEDKGKSISRQHIHSHLNAPVMPYQNSKL